MIITKNTPCPIFGSLSSPVVQTKVIGRNGYTLKYFTLDSFTKKTIGSEHTVSITSDSFEYPIAFDTPSGDAYLLYVIQVLDSSNNIVETISFAGLYLPSANVIQSSETFEDITVISKMGQIYDLGSYQFLGSQAIPLHPSILTIAKGKGRLVIYDGNNKIIDYTGTSAIIELDFKISSSIAQAMANFVNDSNVASALYNVPDLAPDIGAMAYIVSMLKAQRMSVIGASVSKSGGDYIIKVYVQIDLYSNYDWRSILLIISAIGSFVSAIVIAIMSMGVAVPVSLPIIATSLSIISGAISLYMSNELAQSPTNILDTANQISAQAKQEINNYYNQIKSELDTYLSQGKISQSDYNTILNYLDSLVNTANTTIDELKSLIKQAYDQGRKDQASEDTKWMILAGAGGLFLGSMLSRSSGGSYGG